MLISEQVGQILVIADVDFSIFQIMLSIMVNSQKLIKNNLNTLKNTEFDDNRKSALKELQ